MNKERQDGLIPVQEMEVGTLIEVPIVSPKGKQLVIFRLTGEGECYRNAVVHSPVEFLRGVEVFGGWLRCLFPDPDRNHVTFADENTNVIDDGIMGITVSCEFRDGKPRFLLSGLARSFQTTETIDE